MSAIDSELDELLRRTAGLIDSKHCREVDQRYLAALSWEEVDRPPLVVQAPFAAVLDLGPPWDRFRRYSYRETFENPAAMLQNMILDRVVPGLILCDDNPLAIRNNHGTIQVAGAMGAPWALLEDNYPWVRPFENLQALEELASASGEANLAAGVLPSSFRTLEFYHEALKAHPPCDQAIQISLPDLQGPLDTAELLWGSTLYYAFSDADELLNRVLARVTDVMLNLIAHYRARSRDRLDPVANTQHGYLIPGRLLIRDDSAVLLSARTYSEFVLPHDARVLREVGRGSIHFCGNGAHLIPEFLEIPDLVGLDFGQPEMMDIPSIYRRCRDRRVALTNLCPPREDLVDGKAQRDFPTGVVFVYCTTDIEDAREVVRRYTRQAAP